MWHGSQSTYYNLTLLQDCHNCSSESSLHQVIEVEPSIKIVGAYDRDKAFKNLLLLTEFVKMIDVDLVVARREDSSAITQRGDAGQCAACL